MKNLVFQNQQLITASQDLVNAIGLFDDANQRLRGCLRTRLQTERTQLLDPPRPFPLSVIKAAAVLFEGGVLENFFSYRDGDHNTRISYAYESWLESGMWITGLKPARTYSVEIEEADKTLYPLLDDDLLLTEELWENTFRDHPQGCVLALEGQKFFAVGSGLWPGNNCHGGSLSYKDFLMQMSNMSVDLYNPVDIDLES